MASPRTFIGLAVASLPLLVWGFSVRLGLGLGDAGLAAVLLVTLPALAVAQLGVELPDALDPVAVYASSAVMVLVLGGLSLAAGIGSPGLSAMGFNGLAGSALLGWTAVSVAAGLATLAAGRFASRRLGIRETALVRTILPTTSRERRGFVAASIAAGLGEEVAYRGFLLAVLVGATGSPVLAGGLGSLAFGLLHAYQGVVGMVRTTAIGGAFASVVLASGSLWPVILGHTIINLSAGLVLGEWLLDTDRT
jgi:membrane protease YdiL (CAAX protease family)